MTIHIRTRLHRALAAAGAALAAVTACVTLTAAAPSAAVTDDGWPGFLAATDLPPYPGSQWHAGEVHSGTPDPLPPCVGASLPGATSLSREFRTDLDARANQVTVVERDEASAKSLAAFFERAIRDCATRIEQEYPDVRAEWKDYGRVAVEEGAHVYGVHTETSWGAIDIHLFSVGRDGSTVTVVNWGALGDFGDAPVAQFKKTTTVAVSKLW